MILTMRTCIHMNTPGIMRRRYVGSKVNARTMRRCEDSWMNVGCTVFPNLVALSASVGKTYLELYLISLSIPYTPIL